MFKGKRWKVSLFILAARVLMINFNVVLEGLIMEEKAEERDKDRDREQEREKEVKREGEQKKAERILKNTQNFNNYKQTMSVPTQKTHKNYQV